MLMLAGKLAGFFKSRRSALVAFSGGVDSAVLAKAAYDALGEGALAVTFDTPSTPRHDLEDAVKTAKAIGIRHLVVKYSEVADDDYRKNPQDRCYFCKRHMASRLRDIAAEHQMDLIVEGTNAEDLHGHRPGYRALREAGISSPLAELGAGKAQVRALAKEYGLDWGRPSSACLASRVPTGTGIDEATLRKIDESEDYLRSLGITQVRVRVDESDSARIEVLKSEFPIVLAHTSKIVEKLPFRRVTLDLRGYS
jgi:pyridinium-3,5-biscarboxylic acid mononucleotide sulfurtransferase